jgi:TPP-dependent pyruvate/acetoin dehydrogenase alpha subunit
MKAKSAADQAAELREHAERTREALGDTVQKLSDKLDVQGLANEGVQKGLAKAQQATTQVKDTATRALDQAEKKIDDLPEQVREPAHRTIGVVRQRPAAVLLGLLGLLVLWRLLSRRSH